MAAFESYVYIGCCNSLTWPPKDTLGGCIYYSTKGDTYITGITISTNNKALEYSRASNDYGCKSVVIFFFPTFGLYPLRQSRINF
jgi:hypothetical protein